MNIKGLALSLGIIGGLAICSPSFSKPFKEVKALGDEATIVSNATEFLNISSNPVGDYVLVCDIDLSGVSYTPFDFQGRLEGNGFKIKSPYSIADRALYDTPFLFANNEGYIGNLTLDCSLENDTFGGVCQVNNGTINLVNYYIGVDDDSVFLSTSFSLCARNNDIGTISNCSVVVDVNSAILSLVYGPLVCENYGSIESCNSSGSLTVISKNPYDGNAKYSTIGGIVGNNYGHIDNLYSKTNIYADQGYFSHRYTGVGGVIGSNYFSEETIKNLFYKGSLVCVGDCGGTCGISGGYGSGKFSNCGVQGLIQSSSKWVGSHVEYSHVYGIAIREAEQCLVEAELLPGYTPQEDQLATPFSTSSTNCLFTGSGTIEQITGNNIDCNKLAEHTSDYYHSCFSSFNEEIWNFDDLSNEGLPQLRFLSFSKDVESDSVSFVSPLFTLLIDDQSYDSSASYDVVGNHVFKITNNDFSYFESFVIDLNYSGIEDGKNYIDSITPNFSGGTATLDGNSYVSGTEISEIGNHVIVVSGSNGYSKTFNFSVIPSISGVENEGCYDSSITPLISGGELKLDGKAFVSGTTITEPGDHILSITGVNGYSKILNFTVNLIDSGISNGDVFVDKATYLFSGGIALLDGNDYSSGTEITEIGNHTIIVTGTAGFSKTISFTIEPSISGIEDGKTYDSSATPTISSGALTLDGNNYVSGTVVTVPGDHTLVVSGVNGYSKSISFRVALSDSGVVNNASYYDTATYAFSGGAATLDGDDYVSGTEIKEIGNHTIVVTGIGDFSKTINFTIEPTITNITDGGNYDASVTSTISGGTITLDEKPYESGTIISEPGSHIIKITGVNGYSKIISFSINLNDSGISDGDSFIDEASYTFSGGTATLDGDAYESGSKITGIGNHTIVVTGIGDFSKTINFTIEPSIEGVEDGKTYDSTVTPNISGGNLSLDGEDYKSETTITIPGDHILIIAGSNGYTKIIEFTVTLSEEGIVDDGTYYDSATYTFSGGTATLDGNEYISGTEITEIGNHTIEVVGVGGFSKTLSFTIEPTIKNIINEGEYDSSVTPEISGGLLKLDDKSYISGTEINEPGNHILVITGANDYSKEIHFTINLIDSGIEDKEVFVDVAAYTFSGGQATLDGESYTSGSEITEIGNHTIVVTGSNDFSKTINFTIDPKIENITDGEEYEASLTPIVSGGTITLDGNPYTSGTVINEPGNHKLVIKGVNDYSKTIAFSITLKDEGIKDGDVFYKSTSYTFSGGQATLDGQPYESGSTISKIGSHTLVVTGSGDFSKTIEFEIRAIEYSIESSDYSWSFNVSNLHPDSIIKIDGEIISGSYVETRIGNHTLTITNENGYEKTIEFTIKENVNYQDGETINGPIVIDNIEGDVYVDGVKVSAGYRIDQHGKHTITIVGSNGYSVTYTVLYNNPNYAYVPFVATPSVVFIGLAVFMIIKRRRIL